MKDFEARDPRSVETVNQRSERAVAFAGEFHRLAVAHQFRAAADGAVSALRLEFLETPGHRSLDVLAPEHRFEFRAADLSSQAIHLVVGDGAEVPLHFFWQFDS